MSEGSKAIEGYSFLVAFARNGTIDARELAFIEKIALRDGVVDDDEKYVLHNLFARLDNEHTTQAVRDEIHRFCTEYDIDLRGVNLD